MNDIKRARFNRWANRFEIDIRIRRPTGSLGFVWFAMLSIIPLGLLMLSIRINNRIFGRSRQLARLPEDAA
jgi:hypothetical protein